MYKVCKLKLLDFTVQNMSSLRHPNRNMQKSHDFEMFPSTFAYSEKVSYVMSYVHMFLFRCFWAGTAVSVNGWE